MVWKKVEGNTPFFKFTAETPTAEGKYVQCRDGRFGKVYDLETAAGDVVTIPSSRTLDSLMSKIPVDTNLRITRAPEKQLLKNGRLAWAWTIEKEEGKQSKLGAKTG